MRDRYERMRRAQRRAQAEQDAKTSGQEKGPETGAQEPRRKIGFVQTDNIRAALPDQTTGKPHREAVDGPQEPGTAPDNVDIVMERSEAIQDLQELIRRQTEKGLRKYPEEFKEENFSITEVLDHYSEEMVDALLYIRAMRKKVMRLTEAVERDLLAKNKPGFNP